MKKRCLTCAYLSTDDSCHRDSRRMYEGKIAYTDERRCKDWSKVPDSEIRYLERLKDKGELSQEETAHLERVKEALKGEVK